MKYEVVVNSKLIRYARQKLVRRYGVTSASSSVIISNYHPIMLNPPFTLDFSHFIKTHSVADVQKARIHDIFNATRRPCVLRFAEPTKICGNMRHEHASYVLAWTCLELSIGSDLLATW
jgi:hypothetical protein